MIGHIRFHGRGGEGVRLASRIVSRAAFLAGRTVQDSPLYGAERRGAPVVAFVRFADGVTIAERGYIGPGIDYDHCKGCLVCVTERLPRVIAEVRS